jgi:hypothetical protein
LPLELDHVVVFSAANAPEARVLEALGLVGYGGVTRHGSLGTASTAFFFENTYLELLWVEDEAAARAIFLPVGFDLGVRAAWAQSGAAPFGLMLRRVAGASGPILFPTRGIKAGWMPGDVTVEFQASALTEPYYGVVPAALAFPSFQANIPDLPHPLGISRLSGLKLAGPGETLSPAGALLQAGGLADFVHGAAPLMELTFDEGRQGIIIDVRPTLPLRLVG